MADVRTREQLEMDWWAAWWRADYSWAGLAKKLVGAKPPELPALPELSELREPERLAKLAELARLAFESPAPARGGLHGERTLQDYWLRDPATGALRDGDAMWAAGELIDCEGIIFHIAHLPPKTKSGAPTWKAKLDDPNWGRLGALLARRIAGAGTKADPSGTAEGPDGRAQFVGAVLRGAPAHPVGDENLLHLDARQMATLDRADFSRRCFGPGACFDDSLFSGISGFIGVTFSGDASFVGATFSGEAGFIGVTFSEDASFDGAAFSEGAAFIGVTFSEDASFDDVSFAKDAGFGGVTFSEDASFDGVSFSKDANFDVVSFSGDGSFEGSTFFGEASFNSVTFSGDASFEGATFSGDASFEDATFNAEANFDQSAFVGCLRFKATVKGTAGFEGGRCEDRVWFDGSEFTGKFRVAYREFQGRTYLNDVVFRGPMDFQVATFEKFVSFGKIKWPEAARDWHGAFTGVQFRSPVSFEGAGFGALAAFDGATVESRIWIDAADERSANAKFRSERKAAIKSAVRDGEVFEKDENVKRKERGKQADRPVTHKQVLDKVRSQREARLKELEGGCRVLKEAMGRASDKSREQMFYRFELQARRKQRGLPLLEPFFSDLYRVISDYGASIWRPILWLGVLIVVFAGLFWLFATALDLFTGTDLRAGPWTAQFWSTLDFSWGNVFKPLSALSEDAAAVRDGSMIDRLLTEAGAGYVWGVRALATLQSLLALVLAFLVALAVRRRFQIN